MYNIIWRICGYIISLTDSKRRKEGSAEGDGRLREMPSRENRLGFVLFYETLERSFRIVCSHNNLRTELLVGRLLA